MPSDRDHRAAPARSGTPAAALGDAPRATDLPVTRIVVDPLVLAMIAAGTARRTPGVARLQPGVAAMLSQLGRWGREQITGTTEAPHEGVRAHHRPDGVHVELDVVTTGHHLAVTTAHQLRAAIAHDLTELAGDTVAAVTVTVLEVDLSAGLRTDPDPDPAGHIVIDETAGPRATRADADNQTRNNQPNPTLDPATRPPGRPEATPGAPGHHPP